MQGVNTMSSTLFALLALLATVVGALIPIQAATNAAMSRAIGGVAVSSLIVFTIGLLVVGLWVALTRQGLPTMLALRQAPAYGYLGGLIVAIYVLSVTFLAPRLGVANAICFIVTGQIVAAVIIDHLGAFGAVTHAFTLQRGAGIALMVTGLFVAMRQ